MLRLRGLPEAEMRGAWDQIRSAWDAPQNAGIPELGAGNRRVSFKFVTKHFITASHECAFVRCGSRSMNSARSLIACAPLAFALAGCPVDHRTLTGAGGSGGRAMPTAGSSGHGGVSGGSGGS